MPTVDVERARAAGEVVVEMLATMTNKPAKDELEVTLLGPGTGESVVIHVGDDRWVIVDSYEDEGLPAARRYLDDINVRDSTPVCWLPSARPDPSTDS